MKRLPVASCQLPEEARRPRFSVWQRATRNWQLAMVLRLPVASCQLPEEARPPRFSVWQRATGNWQLMAALLLILAPQVLHACPTCYGDPSSPMTKGSNNAILFMLGVIGFVQVGFVGLFVTFWRRARALRRRRESLRLLDGGAR